MMDFFLKSQTASKGNEEKIFKPIAIEVVLLKMGTGAKIVINRMK